jgi:MFS family permease
MLAWQPSTSFDVAGRALAVDLAWLVACQVVIGFALGLIYSASLYFGMVLSDGSTEHGGYHEALIGLGSVIGPGSGALAQYLANGSEIWGVAAVAGVLGTTVVVATIVSLRRRAVTPAEA